jgi:hypothetical protein
MINRANIQPGLEFFEQTFGGYATTFEAAATATSVDDFCERMEAAGLWLRLDPAVWPTMMHGPIVSEMELAQLRRAPNVIRKGRVQRITKDDVILDGGEAPASPGTLYVDCTARAIGANVNNRSPVFSPGLIRLQMVRLYQPTFSAALIGHIEATISDEAAKRQFTQVTPMTDTAEDYIRTLASSLSNQGAWTRDDGLRAWLTACRLDNRRTVLEVSEDDVERRAILARLAASAAPAVQNLLRLAEAA